MHRTPLVIWPSILPWLAALGACGGGESAQGGLDAAADAPMDAEADVHDAAAGNPDGPWDAPAETAPDGNSDAEAEAGTDAASDTSPDSGTPPAAAHAYIANFNNATNGNVQVFDLPLSMSSAAVLTVAQDNGLSAPEALKMDPGGTILWVVDYNLSKVDAFSLPLTATSVPVESVQTAQTPGDLAFDPSGNLWVAEFNDTIEMWTGPHPQGAPARTLKTSSTPPPASDNLFAIAIDSAGVLYAGGVGGPPQYGTHLFVFNTPMTESAPDFDNTNFFDRVSGLLVLGDRLYADTYFGGKIGYFTLPLNAAKAATSVNTGTLGFTLSLSPAGDLVVPGFARNSVAFLAPPAFTTVDFTLSSGLADPRNVAFGP
jgi:sugar lactone lactonase YvrE